MDERTRHTPAKNTDTTVHWGDTVKDVKARIQTILSRGQQDEDDVHALHEILTILDKAEGTDDRKNNRNPDGTFRRNRDGILNERFVRDEDGNIVHDLDD